jgi:ribonuclease Z
VELYGPAGLRNFVRTNLKFMSTKFDAPYAVHELLTPKDPITSCAEGDRHENEVHGRDLMCGEDGLWREFDTCSEFSVGAAPLVHRGTPGIALEFLK